MKTTLLAIAFAVASTPFMFAAQTAPANPPASGQKSASTTTKKHTKKGKKSTPKTNGGSTSK
jgi:hypothetical protein